MIVRKHNGFTKVITGIHRSGKPYLLNTLIIIITRLNIRQIEVTRIMENISYNELRYHGYQVVFGVIDYHEKADGKDIRVQHEIDFIASLGSKKY